MFCVEPFTFSQPLFYVLLFGRSKKKMVNIWNFESNEPVKKIQIFYEECYTRWYTRDNEILFFWFLYFNIFNFNEVKYCRQQLGWLTVFYIHSGEYLSIIKTNCSALQHSMTIIQLIVFPILAIQRVHLSILKSFFPKIFLTRYWKYRLWDLYTSWQTYPAHTFSKLSMRDLSI